MSDEGEGRRALERCIAEAIRQERRSGGDVSGVGWTRDGSYEIEIDDVVYRQVSWLEFPRPLVEAAGALGAAEREHLVEEIRRGFALLRRRAGSGPYGTTFVCAGPAA